VDPTLRRATLGHPWPPLATLGRPWPPQKEKKAPRWGGFYNPMVNPLRHGRFSQLDLLTRYGHADLMVSVAIAGEQVKLAQKYWQKKNPDQIGQKYWPKNTGKKKSRPDWPKKIRETLFFFLVPFCPGTPQNTIKKFPHSWFCHFLEPIRAPRAGMQKKTNGASPLLGKSIFNHFY